LRENLSFRSNKQNSTDKRTENILLVLENQRQVIAKRAETPYLTGRDRIEAIKGMPVYNIDTNQIEKL